MNSEFHNLVAIGLNFTNSTSSLLDLEPCPFTPKKWYGYLIGVLLIIGVTISYVLQFVRIIQLQSSQGISWITIFLANVSTSSTSMNAVIEQYDTIACCKVVGFWKCNGSLLSVYQIGVGWINTFILYVLLLRYFPRVSDADRRNRKQGTFGFLAYVVIFLIAAPVVAAVLMLEYGRDSKIAKDYAFGLGITSAVANVIQWSPQIVKTFLEKDAGSLSIPMLLLQAPGSFFVVLFQGIIYKQNVSTWLNYLLTGIQQVILVIECIIFEIRKRRLKKKQLDSGTPDETTPFIQ